MTKRKHFSPEALDASSLPKHRKPIPHAFVLDALSPLSPYTRSMFGCLAIYVKDRIVLILRDKPKNTADNGVWLATTQEHHQRLRREFPNIRSIQVLGKQVTCWQVLPVDAPDFESAALRACELVLAGDPRIGKIPGARTSKSGSRAAGRSSKQIKPSKKHEITFNFEIQCAKFRKRGHGSLSCSCQRELCEFSHRGRGTLRVSENHRMFPATTFRNATFREAVTCRSKR